MALLNHHIKGNSIVEVVVALVIITSTFIVSGIIFMNLVQYTFDKDELKSKSVVDYKLNKAIQQESLQSFELDTLGINVIFEVKDKGSGLKHIVVDTYSQKGKALYSIERIVKVRADE